MKIIPPCQKYIPKTYFSNPRFNTDGKLVYLAGPVLGGGGWQEEAIDLLATKVKNPLIACPMLFHFPHKYAGSQISQGEEPPYENQIEWEQHFMYLATIEGCLLFWLPKECEPYRTRHPYAMITRDEIGAWRTHKKYVPHMRMVVGIEDGFPGKPELVWLLQNQIGLEAHETLEATINAAINVL